MLHEIVRSLSYPVLLEEPQTIAIDGARVLCTWPFFLVKNEINSRNKCQRESTATVFVGSPWSKPWQFPPV